MLYYKGLSQDIGVSYSDIFSLNITDFLIPVRKGADERGTNNFYRVSKVNVIKSFMVGSGEGLSLSDNGLCSNIQNWCFEMVAYYY